MRAAICMLALLCACLAPPASAQTGDLSGTWAFQTEPYDAPGSPVIGLMSGVAVMTASAPNRYSIRLIANEMLIQSQTSETRLITARENCTGEMADGQFMITCQMAEPLEGYEPDRFVLQPGEADQLVGALSSASDGQVTFTRIR